MNPIAALRAHVLIAIISFAVIGCRQNGVVLKADRHNSGDIIVTICNCIKDSTIDLPVLKTVDCFQPFDSTVWYISDVHDTIVVAFNQGTKYGRIADESNELSDRVFLGDWSYGDYPLQKVPSDSCYTGVIIKNAGRNLHAIHVPFVYLSHVTVEIGCSYLIPYRPVITVPPTPPAGRRKQRP